MIKPKISNLRDKLKDKGLKVTPQRLAILEIMRTLRNHPTAEYIIEQVRKKHPNIATGTVYKVLDTLVEHKLIRRVHTEKDVMRYDAFLDSHCHLYCPKTDRMEDYEDAELIRLMEKHFSEKKIPNFSMEDIRIQIVGEFIH